MALQAGTKVGPYEILSPLGAGGMGEVYRARDSKLGREVAIKVLPEEFTQHPQKLARFEREARLLASLNHPGIATLHGLEEAEGKPFLVMELIEGETLAERITRCPLPVNEALTISQQIAEALEAAHEKGVIHRDLKPANIKVDAEGRVKVLDFGLAKAFADEVPESELSASPTLSRDATRAGVILGTAAYMSPEQAKGKAVDKRTDIFSFGIVLYEMLTGKNAFPGGDVSDVLARILAVEPDWKAVPPELDPRVQSLLRRCLTKDRKKRLRDIGDVRNEIEEILAEPTGVFAQKPLAVSASNRARLKVAWGLSMLVAALVTGIGVWSLMRPSRPEPRPLKRFTIALPPNVVLPTARGRLLALSSDGTKLAFVGQTGVESQLFLRSMDDRSTRAIPGTEGARRPAFSADGVSIGFDVQGQPFKVSLAGGPRVALAEAGTYPTWAPDGTIFFWDGGLWRIPAGGGEPQAVMDSSDAAPVDRPGRPQVLPNGKAVLFEGYGESVERTSIEVVSLETGEQRSLLAGGTTPQYISTGHILFARGQSLFAVPFDAERLEVTGPAVPVVEDLRVETGGAAQFAVASDGSLVYATGSGTALKLVRVDRQGNARTITETTRPVFRDPRLSPDGQRLAVSIVDALVTDVWLLELGRGTLTRLTFGDTNTNPIWSPDGERVIFASNRVEGIYNIFSQPADGSGTAEQLTTGATRVPTSVSSDGKIVVFRQFSETTGQDIGVVRLEGEREPELLLQTPFVEHSGMLSPDDNWLAYVSNESGREEIYVTAFPGPGGKLQISTEGGTGPMWSRDGKELFYWSSDNLMAVTIDASPELIPASPVVLFEASHRPGNFDPNYDVAPDGDGFILIQPEQDEAARIELEVVLNWDQELKRLVPTN